MVMKVCNLNPVVFRSSNVVTRPSETRIQHPQIKEIGHFTPDYAVKVPQTYRKLGETELSNGLKVHSYKLANGYKVTVVPMEGSPATVKNYVNVGAFNETENIKGISHFLEHMAFNGTTGEDGYKKLNPGDSFKVIDKMGGWTNASTSYALTDYVNSTPLLEDKDLEEQIKTIAAMTENLALTPEMIEKEKGPVCSEINMVMDNPNTIAYDKTVRTLFNVQSSADDMVAGSTKHIQNLTQKDVKDYYDKYYTPDNMNLVITGDVNPDEVMRLVSKNFHSRKMFKGDRHEVELNPINKTVRNDIYSDKINSTNTLIAFAGPQNNDVKSKIIFEIISEHIGSVNAGFRKELKPLNTMVGAGSEKIVTKPSAPEMIFFEFSASEENSAKAFKIVHDKLRNLKSPAGKDLEVIKKRLTKNFNNQLDYSSFVNNSIGRLTIDNNLEYLSKYNEILNSITSDDINDYISKYINLDKAAITVVHPKSKAETSTVSFKGAKRTPLNKDKISESKLNNNFKMGFIESNSNNIYFNMRLSYDTPANINPAAVCVLNEILTRGTINKTEEEFTKYQEDNNVGISAGLSPKSYSLTGSATPETIKDTLKNARELLMSPRITEEEFKLAVDAVKDSLSQYQDTADSLYSSYIGQFDHLEPSKEKLEEGLKKLTIDDVKNLHKYIINNSCGTIAVNVPQNNPESKQIMVEEFNKFSSVKPFEYKTEDTTHVNANPVVLSKAKNTSQADIKQVYRFTGVESLKDEMTLKLLNSILSSSSTIGLFNNLREKEQLAYSVYSDVNKSGNSHELSLNILTTTDNKETGEQSFENVQKSIDGFKRQIACLKNSEYSDEDLESAKKMMKASLLDNEGTAIKVSEIAYGLNKKEGIDIDNKAMMVIDSITRDDLARMAEKVFKNHPVYSIVATQDTLNANKDYLEALKKA